MIELDYSLILAVYFGLAILGIIYNYVIAWMERRGYLEGFTWLAVVIGVGATMIAVAVISWQLAVIALGAFVFSGTPMIIGAVSRYVLNRERSQRNLIDEVIDE